MNSWVPFLCNKLVPHVVACAEEHGRLPVRGVRSSPGLCDHLGQGLGAAASNAPHGALVPAGRCPGPLPGGSWGSSGFPGTGLWGPPWASEEDIHRLSGETPVTHLLLCPLDWKSIPRPSLQGRREGMWGQEPQQGLELRGCWPGASLVPGTLVEVWVQR